MQGKRYTSTRSLLLMMMLRVSSRRNLVIASRVQRGSVRSTSIASKGGLYDPVLEKDSCGVGMVAHLRAHASHEIVQDANTMLVRMAHRGGCGCEPNSGDGAGILTGMPDTFLRRVVEEELSVALPARGEYGAGNIFFPRDPPPLPSARSASRRRRRSSRFSLSAGVCCRSTIGR